jgi:hypothetical protein
MRRARITLVAAGACATLTVVAGATGPIALIDVPQDQVQALSGLDVPLTGERGKALIESTFCPPEPGGCAAGQPVTDLIALARDIEADPGVRLRAYRAIGLYPGTAARTALIEDLEVLAAAQPGTEQLYLRAAIEALGEVGEPQDVDNLTPFLDYEPSRDIRAATADALRHLGCACLAATEPLDDRLDLETSQQVILAIHRALRELADTP